MSEEKSQLELVSDKVLLKLLVHFINENGPVVDFNNRFAIDCDDTFGNVIGVNLDMIDLSYIYELLRLNEENIMNGNVDGLLKPTIKTMKFNHIIEYTAKKQDTYRNVTNTYISNDDDNRKYLEIGWTEGGINVYDELIDEKEDIIDYTNNRFKIVKD